MIVGKATERGHAMEARSTVGRMVLATGLLTVMAGPLHADREPPGRGSREVERVSLLLSRATYGARPGELETVLAMGAPAWLERQLNPDTIDDAVVSAKLEGLELLKLDWNALRERYPQPSREERSVLEEARARREKGGRIEPTARELLRSGPRRGELLVSLGTAKLVRAIESERQLHEVMVDFWFNHFNVYARKSGLTVLALPQFEREAIRKHALGRFHDLLLATAREPAMLMYLDNWVSTKEGFDPRAELRQARATRPTRRYDGEGRGSGRGVERADDGSRPRARQRGINENYARELMELHTLGVAGGYTQADVIALARCLTGWSTFDPARLGRRQRRGSGRAAAMDGGFHFIPAMHDESPKLFLGHRINLGGERDGIEALRILAEHPSTARFVSTKLAKRFVSDTPSEELVSAMAATFQRTRGDIRAVLRAMFQSEHFVSEGTSASKIKTPLELVVSTLRASGARLSDGRAALRLLEGLGQPLYLCQPPTGYDEDSATWLTAGSMLNRLRVIGALVSGGVVGVSTLVPPTDVAAWAKAVTRASATLGEGDRATLTEALAEYPEVAGSTDRKAMALVLASPAFQRQ